jgi:hypothetical protein
MMPYLRLLINRFSFLLPLMERQPARYCPKLALLRQGRRKNSRWQQKSSKKDCDALFALAYGGSRAAKKTVDKSSKRLKIP